MLLSFAEKNGPQLAEILQKKERKPDLAPNTPTETRLKPAVCSPRVWRGRPATGRPLSVSKKTDGSRLLMWTEACGAAHTDGSLSFHS